MNWINDNLEILATMGSALTVYFFIRRAASKDVKRLEQSISKDISNLNFQMKDMKSEMKDINAKLSSVDSRVARIEGQLNPPLHWEPRILEKKE